MDVYKERIRPLFDKSGLQDKQLEELFGFPRGVIYKWGTGKYKSYRNYIHQIAAYFHVSTDYLLGNADDPSPPGAEGQPLVNDDLELTEYLEQLRNRPEMRMLFSVSKGATKADIEKAVAIIEALRKTEGRD